ncbi:hypothetical protein BVE84_09090 [Streptococcus azizii]|uniref:DUF4059 family protein n=1 Tax=Streptococcus azizii TaxID=1579424 RepID=A0AB36JN23_9STRE|nr:MULTISPECIES: DUF4059 family protein [Streptococcus]MBF0776773.1 DUF4059 family protein [Streptococcus sp. 19428wD3_AN2]ONK25643.1 hypothetical protein BVE86_09685 [Streptococcus azizii]ONK26027.1 hypothetical protein BVE85_09285 [Streptococcus azizii]ONK26573.1 hypothetical protein BVE84_09090 [Streptococcus azizii]TFU82426.1 DUF4059 family protein [Streptococcus sp. AN2]
MLQTILGLYMKSLLIATVLVVIASTGWFLLRLLKKKDKTHQDRQEVLFDLLIINVMTIPILSFGIVGILLMARV